MSRISETTTLLVVTHHEIDDLLNEWMDEQRDPSLTKSMVVDMALREFLTARGRLVTPSPADLEDQLLKLVEKAFPDETPASEEKAAEAQDEEALDSAEGTGRDEPKSP